MYKKLLNETIIYGVGAILPRLINFGLNPLFISKIPTEGFSQITQLYALASFINIFLTFGFETAFFRFSTKTGNTNHVYSTTFWFLTSTSVLFLILAYLFISPLSDGLDYQNHPEYLIWFAWIALLDTIMVAPLALIRLNGEAVKYAGIKTAQSIFQTGIILLLFFGFSPGFLEKIGIDNPVAYPFIGNLLGSLLGVGLLIPWIRSVKFNFDVPLFKKMLVYAIPIMLAGLAFAVNENLDKTLQRKFLSPAEAGAYGGCYKLAVLMTLFVTAYRMGVEPFLFKKSQDTNAKQTYANILLFFIIIASIAALGLITNLGWLKYIFVPNKSYWSAMDIVPIVIIANLFFGLYVTLSTWYKVTDKTQVGTIISWVGAGITIFLNFFLMPKYGFMVSAWATLIAYASMAIISYVWGQRVYRIPYKKKKIILYLSVLIVICMFYYYFFKNNLIIGNLLWLLYIAVISTIEYKSLVKSTK